MDVHLKSLAIIVFNVTYKIAYKKEEMDERTGMGVEGRGEKVGLKGEKIRGGRGCEGIGGVGLEGKWVRLEEGV